MAQIGLNVSSECDISEAKLHILAQLFNDFLPDAAIPNLEHLQGILIVPDNSKSAVVNNLLHQGKEQGTYTAGTTTHACAVPIATDTELQCFIVLDESFVQLIDPRKPNEAEIVAVLLEELFHIRLYSRLWQQQGYLYPQHDLICTSDLFKLCSGFHDEYIVNRWKHTYLATHLRADNGEKVQQHFASDYPLISHLNQAQYKLFSIIHDTVVNKTSVENAWLSILQSIYRDIFELLARYAAPIAALKKEQLETFIDLSTSKFYQQYVDAYWQQIRVELERSYDSDLEEANVALNSMVKILENFLANIGVTYRKAPNGACQINITQS